MRVFHRFGHRPKHGVCQVYCLRSTEHRTLTTHPEALCPIYRHDLPVFPYTTVASTFPGSERLFRTDCEPNKVSSREQARDTHKDKKIDKKQKILNKKHNFYSKRPKERYFMKQLMNMQIIGIDHGYGVRP